MAFTGWPKEAIDFFVGLEADNSKDYWQSNKAVYESAVRAPMDALLAALAKDFGETKVFRPYRDVRFSRDKTPYKTNLAATLSRGGYLSFSADGLSAAAGYWQMATDQLDRYRRAVDDETSGVAIQRLVDSARRKGMEAGGHGELRRAPKGYPADHPRIELLRAKGLTVWQSWAAGSWLSTAEPKKRVAAFFRAARPMTSWLDEHVGPSTVVD